MNIIDTSRIKTPTITQLASARFDNVILWCTWRRYRYLDNYFSICVDHPVHGLMLLLLEPDGDWLVTHGIYRHKITHYDLGFDYFQQLVPTTKQYQAELMSLLNTNFIRYRAHCTVPDKICVGNLNISIDAKTDNWLVHHLTNDKTMNIRHFELMTNSSHIEYLRMNADKSDQQELESVLQEAIITLTEIISKTYDPNQSSKLKKLLSRCKKCLDKKMCPIESRYDKIESLLQQYQSTIPLDLAKTMHYAQELREKM